jgi:Zn-dependent alcohol dehydrogenase
MNTMKAAVMRAPGKMVIEEISVPQPRQGEVRVRLVATGLCHTDRTAFSGGVPVPTPIVLGHEGAGVVDAVGEGVTSVEPGDHVVLSIVVSCGVCFQCGHGNLSLCEVGSVVAPGGLMPDGETRLSKDGEEIYSFFCQSSFAEFAVVPVRSVVPIDKGIDLTVASLLACGAGTGYGAVRRRAAMYPGATVAVIGCGGVGLAVVMTARALGASTVIAVDPSAQARELAKKVGADHVLDPNVDRVVAEIHRITERGADFAFDAVGRPGTMEAAFYGVRPGGDVVAIGVDDLSTEMKIDLYSLILQRRVTGTYAGSLVPQVDIPAALALYTQGSLPLDALVTSTCTLEDVPGLFAPETPVAPGRVVIKFD